MRDVNHKTLLKLNHHLAARDSSDAILIYPYAKLSDGKKYRCSKCMKDIDSDKAMILPIAQFDFLLGDTAPNQPRFTFHLGCLPRFTAKFNMGSSVVEERLKKFHPLAYEWYTKRMSKALETIPIKRKTKKVKAGSPLSKRLREING